MSGVVFLLEFIFFTPASVVNLVLKDLLGIGYTQFCRALKLGSYYPLK